MLWESSRGSRRAGEWCTLVDLLEDAGVQVFVTTHGRVYDPANNRDRRTLQEDAVDAEYDSGKKSDAIRRATVASAKLGEPHGRVPFGYKRLYDPRTKRLIGQEPEPAEAAIVVELFTGIRKGHSLRSIAKDFNERGIKTRNGKTFDGGRLRFHRIAPAVCRAALLPARRQGPLPGARWLMPSRPPGPPWWTWRPSPRCAAS